MARRYRTMRELVKITKRTYRENGRSWTRAARALGVSRGTLIRVANGYEPKAPKIRRTLGLHEFILIAPCKKCGQAHVSKRCTKSKSFDDNAAAYDAWLASEATQKKLADMLRWAETPKDKRPQWNK